MKYAHYAPTTGQLLGWYAPDLFKVEDIPVPHLVVTDAEWQEALTLSFNKVDAVTKTLSKYDFRELSTLKEDRSLSLDSKCSFEILKGFTSEALGVSHFYPSKLEDQLNLMAAKALGVSVGFACEIDGIWLKREHTAEQLTQVAMDGAFHKIALIQKKDALVDLINAATSNAEVLAITWDTQI